MFTNALVAVILFTAGFGNFIPIQQNNNGPHPANQEIAIGLFVETKALPFPGKIIFKDEYTAILEKLVTPWVLHYTNVYRKENGLDTLQYDDCLVKASGFHTDYLFNEAKQTSKFRLVHIQDPASKWFKGKSPSDRATAAGCQKYCGENALYTSLPALTHKDFLNKEALNLIAKKIARDMVYTQWHNSKPHRDNMLTKGYTLLGASVVIAKHGDANIHGDNKNMEGNTGATTPVGLVAIGVQVLAY